MRRPPPGARAEVTDRIARREPEAFVDPRRRVAEDAAAIASALENLRDASLAPVPAPARPHRGGRHIHLGPAVAAPEQFQSRLGRMLIERGLITKDELDVALQKQQQSESSARVGEILVEMTALSSHDLAVVLAEHLRMPFVDLRTSEIDTEVARLVPAKLARNFGALPVARWRDQVVVAMRNPNDDDAVDALRAAIGARIVAAIADPVELQDAIESVYSSSSGIANRPHAYTCPGCGEVFAVLTDPWVMRDVARPSNRHYIWDVDPAHGSAPAHVCG